MNPNRLKRFILVPFVALAAGFQCSNERDDTAINKCDCQTAPTVEEKKDVEAVVIEFTGYQDQIIYILSTEPKDFVTTSYTAGPNILVPCNSLPSQYRQRGARVIVSYGRKNCSGALTSPNLRSYFGSYVDLTAVRIKP